MPHILGGSTIDTFLWLGWLYPPILLFLYVPCLEGEAEVSGVLLVHVGKAKVEAAPVEVRAHFKIRNLELLALFAMLVRAIVQWLQPGKLGCWTYGFQKNSWEPLQLPRQCTGPHPCRRKR